MKTDLKIQRTNRWLPEVVGGEEGDWEKEMKGIKRYKPRGFPGGAVVENLPANAGDTGSSPGLGGSHMPRSN